MKAVLPSLREKKRYLVFEIISKKKHSFADAAKAIKNQVLTYLGESGTAKAGVHILPDKYKDQKGIIRVNHCFVDQLRAALCFVKDIAGEPVIIRSVGVSGILKKAQTKYEV